MKTSLPLFVAAFWLAMFTTLVRGEDYTYTTNNGTITIRGYTGPGGAVIIPSTINGLPVTRIGEMAFYYSTNLTNVTIPDSVTSIGQWAFNGCSSLTSVTIPNSVTNIFGFVFYACTSLTAITVDALNSFYSSVDGVLFNKSQTTLIQCPGRKAGLYTIPASVTSINDEAFDSCTSLTSVTIPNSVTNIGIAAFRGCTSLTEITVATLNSFYSSVDGVLLDKSQTTLIQYPVGTAGSYTVLNSVSYIGEAAFEGSSKLTNIALGNNITSIGGWGFGGCSSLTNVTIPNSVSQIGIAAFARCTNLNSVTVGSSVSSIRDEAFGSCTSLTRVYFQGNAPNVVWNVFDNSSVSWVYYLPGTTGWGPTFGGRQTALWVLPNPIILNLSPSFGLQTNAFGFRISWATNTSVAVEASTNLANPAWIPVGTNTLTDGISYFSDPQWTNYPGRFYRIRPM